MKERQATLTIIPEGITSLLQPLDVRINRPIKTLLRQKWINRMLEGTHRIPWFLVKIPACILVFVTDEHYLYNNVIMMTVFFLLKY